MTQKVCASAQNPATNSPARLLNTYVHYRSSCGQQPNAWSAAFCNCLTQHSQSCLVTMLAPHRLCLLVQGLQAVKYLYAELCSLRSANKTTNDSPHSQSGAAALCGLAACLLQMCSTTMQAHDSIEHSEDGKQCWASCAESVMDSCTQLVKQSPACARAMVTVPGTLCCALLCCAMLCQVLCAVLCYAVPGILCCAVLRYATLRAALCCFALCCAVLTLPTAHGSCQYKTQASQRSLAKG